MKIITSSSFLVFLFCSINYHGFAQYKVAPHRQLLPGEIPVSAPGNYGLPGTTYVLTKNITSPVSTIFLGKDVTLDLNGYTIKYADGNYNHITNSGFEE